MFDFVQSSIFLNIAFILALFGLAVAVTSDHLQTLAKYRGVLSNRVAGGYNMAMKVMVVNRMGAVLYFLLIALNIDNGMSPKALANGMALTIAVLAIPTLLMMMWLYLQHEEAEAKKKYLNIARWPKLIMLASFLATSCNLMGLTLPWIASAHYPELRLTLANTSFLFNTLFTVVNVFYIEHRLARLIDSGDYEIHGFVTGVMMARLAGIIAVGIGLAFLS